MSTHALALVFDGRHATRRLHTQTAIHQPRLRLPSWPRTVQLTVLGRLTPLKGDGPGATAPLVDFLPDATAARHSSPVRSANWFTPSQ